MSAAFPSSARILVVDDEQDILLAARLLLKRHFAAVETLGDPAALPARLEDGKFDVVLLDMNFTGGAGTGAEGLTLLKRILDFDPRIAVVMITAHADMALAVEAMKAGAADFVVKPWENERLIATLTAAVNLHSARADAAEMRRRQRGLAEASHTETEMIGTSPAMRHVFDLIRRAAPTDANVLILGENGTGKELVAREIHRQSKRAGEVFVRVDLGSIAPALFESELFGHRRGAFTDAKDERIGLFRAAAGGTLFLDEIGNVPLHLQSKLLTALERHEVMPVGSDRVEPIDVRLISATNLAPDRLADAEAFRPDLLYRINTVEIALPPLRERREDIPLLVEHFAALYARKYNLPRKRISAAALEALVSFDWPGNIRALRHAVERAVIMSDGPRFEAEDFPLTGPSQTETVSPESEENALDLETVERQAISKALQQEGGNVSRAAKALGLTRTSLYRRMQKYGL